MISDDDLVLLIAPNVGEQMGGEAIKALQIFHALKKIHRNTLQITHSRNREELSGRLGLSDIYYVEDSRIDRLIWNSVVLRWFLNWWFGYKAVRLAERIAQERGVQGRAVVWQTEPNSPVTPRVLARVHVNCFGPINGNIYYPSIFRRYEKPMPKLRRIFHMPMQHCNRLLFRGLPRANVILCAGGDRTNQSLLAAGCPQSILHESLDCGLEDFFVDKPRVTHRGENLRFIHYGRLVFHKGTALAIRALSRTKLPVTLDVIGRGPALPDCQKLVDELELGDRVRFLDWYENRDDLFNSFENYRGLVLPSLEDANGIVVQEAMALGLPAICLDWGGPQLLVEHGKTGFLVEPSSEDLIIKSLAEHMDCLAADGDVAERMSVCSRRAAESWRWRRVMQDWLEAIDGA